MDFINQASIKRKFIFIVAPLILVLMFLGLRQLSAERALMNDADKIQTLVTLSSLIGEVIHNMQLERGLTAGYLGSRGSQYKNEIKQHFLVTDKSIKEYKSYQSQLDNLSEAFAEDIEHLNSTLKEIKLIRDKTLTNTIPVSEATQFYTSFNTLAISAIERVSSLSNNAEVSREIVSYVNLIQGKEKTGIERALLTVVFSNDRFSKEEFYTYATLLAEKQILLDNFFKNATPEIKNEYQKILKDQNVIDVSKIEQIALTETVFDISSSEWFTKISAKIEKLYDIEKKYTDYILALTDENASSASLAFYSEIIMLFLLSLLITWLLKTIISELMENILTLNENANRVANGETDISVDIRSEDELGELAKSFNMMVQNIANNLNEIKQKQEESARIAQESLRVKIALENTSSNITISDNTGQTIHTNKSFLKKMNECSRSIKTLIPDYENDKFCELSVDDLTKLAYEFQTLHQETEPTSFEFSFEEKTFRVSSNPIINDKNEKIGTVLEWDDLTDELLQKEQERMQQIDERRIANENLRIKIALDNVNSNVAMADTNGTIIYGNKSLLKMFEKNQDAIKKDIPKFDLNRLVGSNFDTFHKSPEHQRNLTANLTETYSTIVTMGGRTFSLVVNPVVNTEGERLGTVIEWKDISEELIAQDDVQRVINAAKEGQLETRINTTDKEGFIKQLSMGINDMLDSIVAPFKTTLAVLKQISEGNFNNLVENYYEGDFNEMKIATNKVAQTVKGLENEMLKLIEAAREGNMSARGDASRFSGGYADIIRGVNEMMDVTLEPLKETIKVLQDMSSGDLSTFVKGNYKGDHAKIKEALNSSLESLNDLLEQVQNNIGQVSAGSNQLATTSNDLSKGSQQQAAAIQEISSTLIELTSQTNQNSDNAVHANQLSQKVGTDADLGTEKMKSMLNAMKDINSASEDISKIIKVIDEIAFQTNLLALNAAVEAARAGEHGKGFAVVAEEVRNLAQRSANAAKETTELIERTMKRVEYGSTIANETDSALSEIVNGIGKVSDIVGEIAAASKEQSNGINQVNTAVNSIDKVTQSNSAGAEETAAASEELAAQATDVQNLISQFELRNGNHHILNTPKAPTQPSRLNQFQKVKKESSEKEIDPNEVISLDDIDFGDF